MNTINKILITLIVMVLIAIFAVLVFNQENLSWVCYNPPDVEGCP